MQVVILCGGKGRRAYPLTEDVPKPMLPIGGAPVLVHVMALFADQGITDFVLAAGYRQEVIRAYFRTPRPGWRVDIVDTGDDTDTGDRVLGCRSMLGERFFVTYGDGLADVPLDALLAFHAAHAAHAAHGGLATLTTVPLACPFGTVETDASGQVTSFREKPVLRDHWINAGFMVMERAVFDRWSGPSLERDVLPALAAGGQVHAYRHDGFFKALDSYKDQQELHAMLVTGEAPWRRGGPAR